MKEPLLIAHLDMDDPGGGTAVFAWSVAALARDYQVTIATLRAAPLERLDQRFGTRLAALQARIVAPNASAAAWLFRKPAQMQRLKVLLLSQLGKRTRLAMGAAFALSTSNELDLGARAVQYVHFPFSSYRPDVDRMRGVERGLALAYLKATDGLLARHTRASIQNLTLCNSTYTRDHYARTTGQQAEILYPPARSFGSGARFQERALRVVGVGRISAEKRWLEAIALIERVRARGVALELDILGAASGSAYQTQVQRAAEARPWVRLGIGLPRSEVAARVGQARFGLHLAIEEHFGIAVAELLSAGCVTFVHDSAGPAEIVSDRACRFRTLDEAADLLIQANEHEDYARELQERAIERAQLFSEQRFMTELRDWFSSERAHSKRMDKSYARAVATQAH
jgi:glycosyltransferase involved in cell wall biosynthesis